jgi:hypothetical protein
MSYDFAVFAYEPYSSAGGWNDLVGIYATVEEAMEKGKEACDSMGREAHIVHLQQRRIIIEGGWSHIASTLTGQPATVFFSWTAADERERNT